MLCRCVVCYSMLQDVNSIAIRPQTLAKFSLSVLLEGRTHTPPVETPGNGEYRGDPLENRQTEPRTKPNRTEFGWIRVNETGLGSPLFCGMYPGGRHPGIRDRIGSRSLSVLGMCGPYNQSTTRLFRARSEKVARTPPYVILNTRLSPNFCIFDYFALESRLRGAVRNCHTNIQTDMYVTELLLVQCIACNSSLERANKTSVNFVCIKWKKSFRLFLC